MKIRLAVISLWLLTAATCFAQGAAAIVFASGAAQIVDKDGHARAAVRGGEIVAGETIETSDGRTQLRFRDGASMSLQPATRFRVDEFRFVDQGGKASEDDRGFFSLLKGGFRTLSGLIGKERRQQYKVDAAVATIGIRGTDYSANLTDAGLSVRTFGGLVEVCSDAGCVQVAPGETVVVADRNSLPRKQAQTTGVTTDAALPDLPQPKAIEPPEMAPVAPSEAPATSPTNLGPNASPVTGPYR